MRKEHRPRRRAFGAATRRCRSLTLASCFRSRLGVAFDLEPNLSSSKAAAAAGRDWKARGTKWLKPWARRHDVRKERQRRAAAPKARLCGLCSFPRVTGAISETNYWNTSSIPIFVGWKKCMSLSYPNSIFLPGFCLSLRKYHSVSWLVENPLHIGFNHLWMSCE